MARFTKQHLHNGVSGAAAWKVITDALRAGGKSVEVRVRFIEGENRWEVRLWDGVRQDGSNAAAASENKDY